MSFSPSRLPACVTPICVVLFILWAEIPGVCQSSGPLWQQLSASTIAPIETVSFSADQLFIFAEQLMREGEYFRAITEYRRFLFYYPMILAVPWCIFPLAWHSIGEKAMWKPCKPSKKLCSVIQIPPMGGRHGYGRAKA